MPDYVDPDDLEGRKRLKQEYLETKAEEDDAASRAATLADQLRDLGVEPEML